MKFVSLIVAIAAAAVVQKDAKAADPQASHDAYKDSLANGLKVVAGQNAFEANHGATHAAAMANADNECQTLKNSVRSARTRQITESNQIPPMKTYGSK